MATSAHEGPDGSSVVSATATAPVARERFWNLPNTITMLRVGVVPVLLVLPLADDKGGSQLIAWFFIVGANSGTSLFFFRRLLRKAVRRADSP